MKDRLETWDVITADSVAPDSLWAGYITANRLAAAGCPRVRLFVESVEELARCVRFINPTFWIQEHNGFEIYDQNLASVIEPATQVVRVFDSPLAGKYLDRLVSGSSMRRLMVLQPFSKPEEDSQPCHTIYESSSLMIQHIQQGERGHGAGFLKDLRTPDMLRAKWQANNRCREATLGALGIADQPAAKMTIFVADALRSCWLDFVRALVNLGQTVHLLIGAGPQRPAFKHIAAQYESLFGPSGSTSGVSISNLPKMQWSQYDEVVWLSDLVVTSSESMASRAMQSGCPLLWSADMQTPTQGRGFMPAWYTQHIDPECASLVQALTIADGGSRKSEMDKKMHLYFSHWTEVKALATSVCERIHGAADIVEAMIDLPPPKNTSISPSIGFADTMPRKSIPVIVPHY